MFKIIAIEIPAGSKETMLKNFKKRVPNKARHFQKFLAETKEARYNSVMKVLGNKGYTQLYKFYRNYEIKDGKVSMNETSQVVDDYFKGKGEIDVNICAVVGKNGSGKSTLLELMLRLLNNVAYALQSAIENSNSEPLCFAESVYARLYFEIKEGQYCYIEQEDITIRWVNISNCKENWEYTHKNGCKAKKCGVNGGIIMNKKECRSILQSMFYTIVINYSAYSLNTEDFLPEWHICDEDNDINYNSIPNTYGNDRANMGNNENHAEVNDDACWIRSLFHKNDAYQAPIVLNPYRIKGNIDTNKEKSLINDRLFLLLLENKKMLQALLGGKEPFLFIFDRHDELWPIHFYTERKIFNTIKVRRIFEELGISYWDYVDSFDRIGKEIISCWEKCYGYKFVANIDSLHPKSDDDQIETLNYIVYKTIKITTIYEEYKRFVADIQGFIKEEHNKCYLEGVRKLVLLLYGDMSHITLKIRRAIAFLTFDMYGTHMQNEESHNRMLIEYYIEKIKYIFKNQNELMQSVRAERRLNETDREDVFFTRKGHRRPWKLDELLPTPSLKTTISLKIDGKENESIPFYLLSSGERQMIYSLGTMTYQLHHLNSVEPHRLQYSRVNLVFDEIDLYFHPGYQKELINRLIQIINSMELNVVKHINIIIATHSPFILSDIPQTNILYLCDGKDISKRISVNPLGANINDILHQSFFLEKGFIGDYINDKIKQLIDDIKKIGKKGKRNKNAKENYNCIEKRIKVLGDPFFREQLWALYTSTRAMKDINNI